MKVVGVISSRGFATVIAPASPDTPPACHATSPYSTTGVVIVKSESASSTEMVSTCLLPGTYYLHVHAYGDPAENPYTLTYTRTAMSCGGMVCTDDPDEPDDSYSSARRIDDALPHMKANNQICAMDDDWYRVNLFAGETVYATIAFTQTTAAEDLDLHLYRGTTDLTPCSESAPGTCSAANGQGSNSNENMSYTVSTAGYYYVVVHGWNGAQNGYNICIGLSSTACPPLP